jgi:GTP cyclohydrolase II
MFGHLSSTPLKTAHGKFNIAVLPEAIKLGTKNGKPVSTFIEPYAMIPDNFDPRRPVNIYLHNPNVVDDVFRYRNGKRYPIQSRILKRLAGGDNGILLYIDKLTPFDREILTKGLKDISTDPPFTDQVIINRFCEHLQLGPGGFTLKHTRKKPFSHPDYPESFSLRTDLAEKNGLKYFRIQPFFETHTVPFPPPALHALFPDTAALGEGHSFIKILKHYAIIANAPTSKEQIPLVRVHSSCCTGDFNGSLQCDCGPQLRKALRRVAEAGYGAVIYHDSEGRGIHSLAIKMELYKLHAAGVANTYGSMHQYGYPDDMRDYTSAVELLKQIGMPRVELLTNNPTKIERLQKAGLQIASTSQIGIDLSKADENTRRYITAKIEHGGHKYIKPGHDKHEK